MEIHRGGEIVFTGGPEVLLPGEHRIIIPTEKIEALFDRLQDQPFLSMRHRYKGWTTPTERTTLCLRGAEFEHCVEAARSPMFSAGEPAAFGELAEAARQIMPPERWIRAAPETIDVFQEENLDPRSIGGQRLVFQVAQYYDLAAMQALIARGFPVAATRVDLDFDLTTPVEVAAYNGKVGMMRALIGAGAWRSAAPDIRQRTLRAAAQSCQPEVVQAVFDEGVVLQPKAMTLDVLLCRSGMPRAVDPVATAALMLKHGLPVDIRDSEGRTALHRGLGVEVTKLLLREGADPNARDASGRPPLLTITDEDTAIALIEAGADIDVTCQGAVTAEGQRPVESIDTFAKAVGWSRVQALVNARRAEARAKAL
jgi:hypothetical protein